MAGEVFVVLPPATQPNLIIYGRVSYDECQEIIYFPSGAQPNIKLRNIEIEGKNSYGIILSKSNKAWGGLSGSNDKNVTIGLVYRKNESGILGDELLRLALERSSSAEDAIDTIAKLVNDYSKEPSKEEMPTYGFVICDPRSAWILNLVGSLWAAEKINDKFRWIGNGLTIETKIDKCSENLQEKCKSFLLWNGEDDFNFKQIFDSTNVLASNAKDIEHDDDTPFTVQKMFDLLRSINHVGDKCKSSHVSVINKSGITVNWFTATSTKESVFKPFIFTPNVRISPLTKVKDGEELTLLNKLHSQRNWDVVGTLLQSLENTCVEEVNNFINENPGTPNQELDDLMKDCVEAEVKFYR